VRSIAASIAQPYGIIHTHVRTQLKSQSVKGDPYDCIVASFDYWLSNDAKSHLSARQCIESRLTVYPNSHALHAFLTYLHLEEHRQRYNVLSGNALDRALQSAQRAVQFAPSSARSHQALLAAHFARNETELAWQAAGKAMELNPNDTEIIQDIGARHIQSGNYEKGLELLQQALDLNNAPPTWAVTFRVVALYMLGRTDQSSPIAITLRNSNYGLAMVAVMMAAAEKGDFVEANAAYDRLIAAQPVIANDLSGYLKKLVFDEKTARQIVTDFDRAKAYIAANRK
jgi:tetratricopeptide (TPR) repeat protein